MGKITVAIQYPSFGPQHPPRLRAIVGRSPLRNCEVVAMEMFAKDSDYEWDAVPSKPGTGYRRHTVYSGSSNEGRGSDRDLERSVVAALEDIKPDVLVVNGWGHKESRYSLKWCRATGTKFVLLSDSVYENRRRLLPLELYKKWLVRGASAGFVAGRPQARYLARLGVRPSKIFHPGACSIDNDYWTERADSARERADELRKDLDLPERYFFMCSRFLNWKNIPFVIDAFSRYRASTKGTPIDLVICGSGEEEPKIKSKITNLGLDQHVTLRGFQQIDQLPIYYGLSTCFIHASSSFECWGLVVNEAMASGLPVLVSKAVGSAEDLVANGINGFVFDPRNVQGLAQLMDEITIQPNRASIMGERSREIIEGHSVNVGADAFWNGVISALPLQSAW